MKEAADKARGSGPWRQLRRYLIAGLLIWVPLGVTVLVIKALVDLMDRTLLLLPYDYRPEVLLGIHIPGFGIVLSVIVVLGTGMAVANLLGRRLITVWESFLARIPLVRTIYIGVKRVAETLLSSEGRSFRQVLMVEYPRRGAWSLCFLTSTELGEVQEKTGEEVVGVFVPTTPNPTSGFILMVPWDDVVELDMTVEEGIRMIISMGVITPEWPPRAAGGGESLAPPPAGS